MAFESGSQGKSVLWFARYKVQIQEPLEFWLWMSAEDFEFVWKLDGESSLLVNSVRM